MTPMQTPEGGHNNIADLTADIPGLLMPGDHEALYETAYHHGDVILEIGAFAGKSAVIELLGARANPARIAPPVYIGVDVDALAVFRTWETLRRFKLERHAALFLGDLASFRASTTVSPSMVFLDGNHLYGPVRADLECLEQIAAPGTPVLCHDYVLDPSQELEAKPAIDDFVKEGRATFEGTPGGRCALIRLTGTACGRPAARPADFETLRDQWLLDAAASLAASWHRLNDENARQKARLQKADQKLKATTEKMESRVKKLKSELETYQPLLGRLVYRKD